MKKLILSFLVSCCMMVGALAVPAISAFASVQCPQGSLNAGATVSSYAECSTEQTDGDEALMPRIKVIINVVLGVLAVVAVAMIIIGGITYTTSQGDPEKVKKGKDIVLYSVIGLVVALLGFAIVNFVLKDIFNK